MKSIESASPFADWPVHIRPLAFMRRYRLGHTPDTVANMYIIGPKPGSSGPCLLYRPLLDQPLRQFPSEQNMLYAFYQSGELRDSILAWLATRALSFEYAHYVFASGIPSPWTISELAFEPFIHLDLTAPVGLVKTPLKGDILAALFDRHSMAMAELADRQSTSNGERRWALLADSGWAIFSVAANFLDGPAGAAVWVWQSIGQIQQALDAAERGDSVVEWSSIGDVLLTLGILLTQRVAVLRLRQSKTYSEIPATQPEPIDASSLDTLSSAIPAIVTHDATALNAELPEAHLSALSPAGLTRSTASERFLKKIDAISVPAPGLADDTQPNAAHLHEFEGKLYAKVGTRWFEVRAQADEPVFAVDPDRPSYPGLGLKFDAAASRWHWDLKLRLRGGGPTGKIAALRREKAKIKDDAWAALRQFMEQEAARKALVDSALAPAEGSDLTTPMTEEAIDNYITRSDELASGYDQALKNLETWREAGGSGVFYQSQLMRFTIELHRHRSGWMRMKLRDYAKIVAPLMDAADPADSRATRVQAAKNAVARSDEMLASLDRMHTTLDQLTNHSGVTRKVAGNLRKIMPSLSPYDLKANEISLSTELCLREASDSDLAELRRTLTEITDNAADAGHSLVERRRGANPADQPLSAEQLTALVDRLADAERRLKDVAASSAEQLEPVRLQRVETLVAEFHQVAREHLLKVLPEADEIPLAQMARLEPVSSTSRGIGKVSKSRPRVVAIENTPSVEEPEVAVAFPVIKPATRRPKQQAALRDREMIVNGFLLSENLGTFIEGIRVDSQRPSRIPADMKDLLDQHAARLEQAARDLEPVFARAPTEVGATDLVKQLRTDAAQARREGVAIYGAMLVKRRPRETYLKWLQQHDLVTIVQDERGRIKTRQRKDYFQEYRILDKARQDKPLWVAHFHYDALSDPNERFTAAHLKFADAYLKELPAQTGKELGTFDALDNALRRIVDPAVRDLFLKPEAAVVVVADA